MFRFSRNKHTPNPVPSPDEKLSVAITAAERTGNVEVQATLYYEFFHSLRVQLALAENPRTHARILWGLARNTHYQTVREAVIENPSTPEGLLLFFTECSDLTLQDLALDTLIMRVLEAAEQA